MTPPSIDDDTIDDLLYSARTSDVPSLQSQISDLTATHSLSSPSTVLTLAVDPESKNTLLHYAAANGSVPTLTYLLSLLPPSPAGSPSAESRAILDATNASGNTALHWAALNGHLEAVQKLLESGADPGVRNAAGRDVIVEAEMSGKEEGLKVAEWLLGSWDGVENGVGAVGDDEESTDSIGANTNGTNEQVSGKSSH
jgi:uncharacterized protein